MKTHYIILRTDADARRAQVIVQNAEVSRDAPIEVVIREYKHKRSVEQNRCYWKWLAIIAEDTGNSVDDLHIEMKMKYLVPIVRSTDPVSYYEHQSRIHKMYERCGQHASSGAVRVHLADVLSTSTLKVKNFMQYLDQVEQFALGLGIVLDKNAGG